MKKIILVFVVLLLVFILTGCNMSVGIGSMTFTDVHICDFSGHCSHATIEKWYDNDNGIEVCTKEFGSIFLSEGTYILYNDTCPVCGE